MACNSQGFWTPWWWLRLGGRNMLEWLNNNKLINPKLICAFCWFVLFFKYKMCVLIFSKTFVLNFPHSKKKWTWYYQKYTLKFWQFPRVISVSAGGTPIVRNVYISNSTWAMLWNDRATDCILWIWRVLNSWI